MQIFELDTKKCYLETIKSFKKATRAELSALTTFLIKWVLILD